ncbi:MAG: hypothetical protein DMF04_09770 [Verrucomicrobia bacterium]|nr:MAG: hypothetical protein DMF04_09770 [Verrucomicrobiota bacterium]
MIQLFIAPEASLDRVRLKGERCVDRTRPKQHGRVSNRFQLLDNAHAQHPTANANKIEHEHERSTITMTSMLGSLAR